MRRFSILPLLIIPVCRLWKKGFQSWQVEKIMIKFTQIELSVTEKKKSPGEIGKTTWIDFLRGTRARYTSKHVGVCDRCCWLHIVFQSDLSSVPKTTHIGILDIKLKLRQLVRLLFADSPMSSCVSAVEQSVMKSESRWVFLLYLISNLWERGLCSAMSDWITDSEFTGTFVFTIYLFMRLKKKQLRSFVVGLTRKQNIPWKIMSGFF